jgi:glycosyltransferase involved in cell wall biosynthesis
MTRDTDGIRVVLDARMQSGHRGGVEQVVIGMAHGLSALEGPERYIFMAYEGSTEWLRPFVSGPCSIIEVPAPYDSSATWRGRLSSAFPRLAEARRRVLRVLRGGVSQPPPVVPESDGIVERLGVDVVHFLTQSGFLTRIPTIYHPHDLQHRHLPEFFSPEDRVHRDLWWSVLCEQARVVSVTSQWGKRDLMAEYGIDPGKIAVVHLAPAIEAYAEPTPEQCWAVAEKFGLPARFALYPAQTWPHKNHIRLVRAIGLLRDRGLDVELVCTGTLNDRFAEIEREVRDLRLEDRIRFLGFVSSEELQALYRLGACLIMPTLFEAAGGFGPIAEAFSSGLPVACSNVTSLPEEVGDAALTFDPCDEEQIALALGRLWQDESLRDELAARGRARVARYSWDKTARIFRAHYRLLAGSALTEEDQAILAEPTDY